MNGINNKCLRATKIPKESSFHLFRAFFVKCGGLRKVLGHFESRALAEF